MDFGGITTDEPTKFGLFSFSNVLPLSYSGGLFRIYFDSFARERGDRKTSKGLGDFEKIRLAGTLLARMSGSVAFMNHLIVSADHAIRVLDGCTRLFCIRESMDKMVANFHDFWVLPPLERFGRPMLSQSFLLVTA